MPRAMWKGKLNLGSKFVSFKLHAAIEDRHVHFRMLHENDLAPIQQRLENPETGAVLSYKEAKRGLVVSKGNIVVVADEDMESLVPEPSRDIEVVSTLPLAAVDPIWFERPYFLTPDEDDEAYAALVQALQDTKTQILVRWVMRKQHYVGAVRAEGDHLMLFTLAFADEVVQLPVVRVDESAQAAKEAKLAEQLLEALRGDFDISRYEDTYRDKVVAFARAKDKGEVVRLKRPERKQPTVSVEDALRASLKKVEHGKAG